MKIANIIKINVFIVVIFLLCSCSAISQNTSDHRTQKKSPTLHGPYLGMATPGDTPEIFAPKIISTPFHEHSFTAFSPDGTEVFWNTFFLDNNYPYPTRILSMTKVNGLWSAPKYVDFNINGDGHNPSFSPDGNTLFFAAVEPSDESKMNLDIWFVNKTDHGWGQAKKIPGEINTNKPEGQVSVTKNGTLYFWSILEGVKYNYGIFRSQLINGKYKKAEPLPQQINGQQSQDWTPFISPDESFILWSSIRQDGYGSGDLYISFRSAKGEWSEAINLGPEINTNNNERFPGISPDGKYLFYVTDQIDKELLSKKNLTFKEAIKYFKQPKNGLSDVYWVSTKIIKDIRLKYQSDQ